MSETSREDEAPIEHDHTVVAAVKVRCAGVDWNETRGVYELAIEDTAARVDALITSYRDGCTRVSCMFLDRNSKGTLVCRAPEGSLRHGPPDFHFDYNYESPIDEDRCAPCLYTFSSPNEGNLLIRSDDVKDEPEATELPDDLSANPETE